MNEIPSPEDIARIAQEADEEEAIESDEEDEDEPPAVLVQNMEEAPPAKKRGRPPTYSYPIPQDWSEDRGAPRFISHSTYVEAACRVEQEHRVTYKKALAAEYGVNFDTCLRLLPYWDVIRCFAMDVLHDIYLGPVRLALEETFGRENLPESDAKNASRALHLPKCVGELVSQAYATLAQQMPSERKLNLASPHSKHQYYKGMSPFATHACNLL